MTDYVVRGWRQSDIPALYRMNQAAVPAVSSLTEHAFERLVVEDGFETLVVESSGEPAGFVLCLIEGLNYTSLNYQWLSHRYREFAYVDRIAVCSEMRGLKLGWALCAATFARFTGMREVVLAEVNLAPPNPGSLRFHQRLGFREIGQRWDAGHDKGVVYLERTLHAE